MAIEPIKGFYVHDEETDTDGVAKIDWDAVENAPDVADVFISSDDFGVVENSYINALNGQLVTGQAGVSTNFIDIRGRTNNTIEIRCTLFSAYGVAVYDENHLYITGIAGSTASEYGYENTTTPQEISFEIPENSCYLRCSMRSSFYTSKDDFEIEVPYVISEYAKLQFEKIINLESKTS